MNNVIIDIFKKKLESFNINVSKINENTLIKDLGIDSLDLMHIVIEMEEKYGIFFEEDDLKKITTVKSLINIIELKNNEK